MDTSHRGPARATRNIAPASAALLALLSACAVEDAAGPELEPVTAFAQDESGEIWIAAQDRSEIHILHGFGDVEVISLPPGTGPHEIEFSPSGRFAYAANVDDGSMRVFRTSDRAQVAMFALGDASSGDVGTHQARPSPDGSVVLVSQIPSRTLVKIAADEDAEAWEVAGELVLDFGPVCSAFSADGSRAYVSLAGPRHGIAVVDVATMSLVTSAGTDGILDTDGNVQCGLVSSKDGRHIFVDSWGEGMAVGHFYRLDTWTNELTEVAAFPASDLHGFAMSPNERYAFAAERGGDALRRIDLGNPAATPASIPLDPRPGVADRPDKVASRGNTVYVPLRVEGSVAVVNGNTGRTRWIRLVSPSPNALHGVAVRP
jgi:DNA-binding beta-propeller fold protein YncE